MKIVKILPVLLTLVVLLAWSSPAHAGVSFGFFYSNLSPHGSWLVSAQYGRVWQPDVYEEGWNPYYDGHWVYTDLGWTWVSDYDWGEIPYHYGTWVADARFGWVWVPGYTWAPAWVVFRTGPDYIGWAPVSPRFSIGWSAGVFGPSAGGPFVFVTARDFAYRRVRRCVIPESRARLIVNRTRVINNLVIENNVVVNRGPDRAVIERAGGRRVREERIEGVPRVAPMSRVTRADLRVEPRTMQRGVRAADPVRGTAPAPHGDGRRFESEERGAGRGGGRGPYRDAPRQPVERAPSQARPRPQPPSPHGGYSQAGIGQERPPVVRREPAPAVQRGQQNAPPRKPRGHPHEHP